MAGFGAVAVGSTPFGAGTPAEAIAPPENLPEAARFINHFTGDYEAADDGEYKRMPITRQRVLIALGTLFGSSSVVPDLGAKLPDIIDDSYDRRAEQAIRRAVEDMVVAQEIRVEAVIIERQGGRVTHTVKYRDLTTSNPDTVTV